MDQLSSQCAAILKGLRIVRDLPEDAASNRGSSNGLAT